MSASSTAATPARILLVDDHPTFRAGLRSVICHLEGLSVCAEAEDESSAMRLLEAQAPELMIVDLSLGDSSGLRLIQRARQAFPALKILVASMYEESLYGERAIAAGANGYVCKQDEPEYLVEAIEQVCQGKRFVSRKLDYRIQEQNQSGAAMASTEPADILSQRELQVFGMIGTGLSTKEIAARLNLSSKTVDAHRDHVKRKLNIKDNNRLVHRAVEWMLSQ